MRVGNLGRLGIRILVLSVSGWLGAEIVSGGMHGGLLGPELGLNQRSSWCCTDAVLMLCWCCADVGLMLGCLVQSLGWIRGAADVVGPAARLKMWRHTWSSSPPEISQKPPILPFSSFQPICFLYVKKKQWKSHYQQVELWWESLGVICLSCGCTNSHTIVGPAVIHPQFDNMSSCLSSLPKICTSTQILISKSGGGDHRFIPYFQLFFISDSI